MITLESPIVGKSIGSPEQANAYARAHGALRMDEVEAFHDELYRLCGLVGFDGGILAGQAAEETGNFTNRWWSERLNSGSIGITGDPAQNKASHTWANGKEAARAHVVHMLLYVYPRNGLPQAGVDLYQKYVWLDPRASAVDDSGFRGTVRKLGDLGNGKWAADPNYAPQIRDKANAIFKEEPTVAVYPVVGLPGPGIELPVPLAHQIIDLSQSNQRPGIQRQTPGYFVVHETANTNPGADAQMHSNWLHNGADGAQLSFHFAVDDGIVIQLIPIDEVTWQAADGNGPGNMSGVSCELCVNAGIDTAMSRHNAEALAGGICKALGLGMDRVKRHWDFNAADPNRHHCPDQMMTDGYWPEFVAQVGGYIHAKPAPVPPPTTYAAPDLPDWWDASLKQSHPSDARVDFVVWHAIRRNVEAIANTYRYSKPDIKSAKAGPPVKTRDKIAIERWFVVDGVDAKGKPKKVAWLVASDGCFLAASRFSPRIAITPR